MSKVICDVCGTTFPETAAQCPICGSARNGGAQTAAGDGANPGEAGAYSYVKGGRFSKNNVRKRNQTGEPMQRRSPEPPKKDDEKDGSNKGLVIVVIVLLLAIIAVCIYIGVRFFWPESEQKPTDPPKASTTLTPDPTDGQTEPTENRIPCTQIQLSSTIIEFTDLERSQLLSAIMTPTDTTDKLVFTSADPTVATVTEGGLVAPVASGETVITVTCGDITAECRVVCNLDATAQPTEPTTPPTEAPESSFQMIFNTKYVTGDGVGDVTMKVGQKWKMYTYMTVDPSEVVWTSDNEAYATIKDGVVTAVAPPAKAYVLVHAEYDGVKYSCRIRINPAATSAPAETTPPAQEEPTTTQPVSGVKLSLNRTDFTLHVSGNSHNVYKGTEISASVAADSIVWTSADPRICTVENGIVSPVGVGDTQIFAEYNGQTVSCIVRVRE